MRLENVIKCNYDYSPNKNGYYLLTLANNIYSLRMGNIGTRVNITGDSYINGVRCPSDEGKMIRLGIKRCGEDLLKFNESPSALPVIGEYEDGIMRDLVTRREIAAGDLANSEAVRGLSYIAAFKVTSETALEVLKSLSTGDIKRYAERLDAIDRASIMISDYARKANSRK